MRLLKTLPLAALLAAAFLSVPGLHAQERRGERERFERFNSPHWLYDDRYRHGHYYPALGYSVPALPVGNIIVTFGGGRLFFHAGVFFRAVGPAYVVVRPPLGVVVPVLPPSYASVWIAGAPYYYANETYYSAVPGGAGYAVVAPLPGAELATASPVPPPAAFLPQAGQAPGSAAQPSTGNWYYCESSKAYYPYVQECREGWRQVPATPPTR